MTDKLRTKLFVGCKTPDDKVKREDYIRSCSPLLEILIEVLSKDLDGLNKVSQSSKRYDDQSWPYKQADYNGCKRTLEEVITLLNVNQPEKKDG